MGFTGLSEFLWFLLLFGAMFAFTVWRQQRDRRRRQERMARMSTPVEFESGTVPPPLPAGLETAPDISWGRGPAAPVAPPEIRPEWTEVSPRPPPAATRAPRRAPPPAAPAVAARARAIQLRSEAGLRQAVIAMTVLGPCRALEPYGAQWPQHEPGGANRPSGAHGEGR